MFARITEWRAVFIYGSLPADVLYDGVIYAIIKITVNLEKLIFAATNN